MFEQELLTEDFSLKQVNRKGGRVYVDEDNNEYPSITSVLSILSEAGIKAWRARVGEEEANRVSSRAIKRGNTVHSMIENYIMNKEVDHTDLISTQNFKDIQPVIDGSLSKVYAIEKRLYSKHLWVAGTVDCVGEWDGRRAIIDWKTSAKYIASDEGPQVFTEHRDNWDQNLISVINDYKTRKRLKWKK